MSSNNQVISVLFVDDEPELLSALSDYFAPFMTVRVASSGDEALEILQSYKPDVVVSDQRMGGMSGVEFLERSITLSSDSGRILLTGYGSVSSIVLSINRAKISNYITKPVDFQQLRMTVERLGEATHLRRQNADLARQLSEVNAQIESAVPQDNSELNVAYNRLRQAQRVREQMVRMAVHDLKAPLGNIDLILTELIQQNIDPSDYQELIEIALQSTSIMRSLVEDMLTVATLTQPEFNPPRDYLLLSPYLRNLAATLRPTADKKRIALNIDVPDGLPSIYADPQLIRQIVYNLLSNAIKYTPSGGEVFFSAFTDDKHIVVEVRDTGLGMTQNDIQNAFQEFQRLSARPTGDESSAGLGLFIVKKATELNGGTIGVISDGQGKGTTFTVKLPKPEQS